MVIAIGRRLTLRIVVFSSTLFFFFFLFFFPFPSDKSNPDDLKPEDFAVISTIRQSVWFKHVSYDIPSDLPACPPGGCHCSWGWVHSVDSGSQQIYHTVYRCNVTGATNTVPIPEGEYMFGGGWGRGLWAGITSLNFLAFFFFRSSTTTSEMSCG